MNRCLKLLALAVCLWLSPFISVFPLPFSYMRWGEKCSNIYILKLDHSRNILASVPFKILLLTSNTYPMVLSSFCSGSGDLFLEGLQWLPPCSAWVDSKCLLFRSFWPCGGPRSHTLPYMVDKAVEHTAACFYKPLFHWMLSAAALTVIFYSVLFLGIHHVPDDTW